MDMALPVPGIPPLSMEMLKKGKTAGVTLVQPVFMGGRIVNGNKLANIGKQVSKYQLSLTEDQVEASVNQYYWQIVALKEKLRTLETLETQLKGIYKDVKAAVDAGLTITKRFVKSGVATARHYGESIKSREWFVSDKDAIVPTYRCR